MPYEQEEWTITDQAEVNSVLRSINQCPRRSTEEWGLPSESGTILFVSENQTYTAALYENLDGTYDFHYRSKFIYSRYSFSSID
ncbi:hypothetical protein GCM10008967_37840 [Bacillus carboniphilus]|uniref:Group-specific protein n=1 Tax=Bacillus carboniphilus TaxID=86663 RepID=A0ABP3GF00_9BACI